MILGLLIVILLILVVWFGSTSYGPKLLMNYVFVSMSSQHPQMEMEMRMAGISKWQLASLATKKEFADRLNAENALVEKQIEAGRRASSGPAPTPAPAAPTPAGPAPTPNSAAAPAPAIAPVPVVAPAAPKPAAAPSSATAAPTPVVEKFRTNMAQMFGSMHA